MTTNGESGFDWLTPGREVVVIAGRNDTPSAVLTIERVLTRDVVLSNGDRWNRNSVTRDALVKRAGGAWDVNPTLHAADSPEVARARAAAAERKRQTRAWTLADAIQKAVRKPDWAEAEALHAQLGTVLSGGRGDPAA
jgi:hypothetical protein